MKAPVHDALRLRLPTRRARVLIGIVLTCFGALSARAMYLQVWQNDFLQQEGEPFTGRKRARGREDEYRTCAVARTDVVLHRVDQGVESRRFDQSFLDEQRFQRLDPQRWIRWYVLTIGAIATHGRATEGPTDRPSCSGSTRTASVRRGARTRPCIDRPSAGARP